jgi:hypothetical protein
MTRLEEGAINRRRNRQVVVVAASFGENRGAPRSAANRRLNREAAG